MLKVFKKKSNEMKPNARYLTKQEKKSLSQALRCAVLTKAGRKSFKKVK